MCALEILFLDDAIRNLIRQGKIEQVYSYMQTGTRRGMQTMEQSLTELIQKRLVTVPDAISRSSRPEALVSALERAGIAIPVHVRPTVTRASPATRRGAAGGRELAAMSFWEDRFVHRPHASAVPPNVPQGAFGSDFTNAPEAGHMWFQAVLPADEVVGEPVEAHVDQAIAEAAAMEYRRSGLLRRRKPFPVATALENDGEAVAEVAETANGNGNGNGNGHSAWENSFAPADTYVVPAALNGNGHVADAQEVDVDSDFDKPVYGTEFETVVNGNGNGSHAPAEPVHPPVYEAAAEQDDGAAVVDEDEQSTDFTIPDETREISVPEPRRRGLFRRRDPLTDSTGVDDDGAEDDLDEAAETESSEDDTVESVPYFVSDASADDENNAYEIDDDGAEPLFEEADAFVMSENDEPADSAAGEPAHDEPAREDEFVFDNEPSNEAEPVHDEPAVLVAADAPPSQSPPTSLLRKPPPPPRASPRSSCCQRSRTTPLESRPTLHPSRLSTCRRRRGRRRAARVLPWQEGRRSQDRRVAARSGGRAEDDGRPELVGPLGVPLEPGIVVDGDVKDPVALTHALKAFFDDNGLPRKNVRIGLASSRIGVRTIEVVGIDDEERFDNAVRFKAHEVLPVAVHESVLDYRVDRRARERRGRARRGASCSSSLPAIRSSRTWRCARRRGFGSRVSISRPSVCCAPSSSLRTSAPRDDTATVVVSIGHEASTLLVSGSGACEFTRVFDWGGGVLQEAIAQELDVHAAEAATILRHLALSGTPRQLASLDDEARQKAVEAIRSKLTPFARELVSSLQFYQTQPESLGIGEIVITGGTSHLVGLADSLHQMIGVNVRVGDPLQRVVAGRRLDPALEATIGSLAVPIGLAIEDEAVRSVNLLPSDMRAARAKPDWVKVAVPVAAAASIAALGFLFLDASERSATIASPSSTRCRRRSPRCRSRSGR